jgi:glyoxylase I family protein
MKVKKIHHVAIICSDYEQLGRDIVEETYRSDRQSYKLDLMVGGGIYLNCSHFLIDQIVQLS